MTTNDSTTPAADGLEVYPFAYCCAEGGGSIEGCDCVNKDHGYAYKHARHSLATTTPAADGQEPFAWFQWNSGWKVWEEVVPEAAGTEGVVAAYRHSLATPTADVELCERLNAYSAAIVDDEADGLRVGLRMCAGIMAETATRIEALAAEVEEQKRFHTLQMQETVNIMAAKEAAEAAREQAETKARVLKEDSDMQAARAERAEAERDRMKAALAEAARIFAWYAKMHRDKGTEDGNDKAQRNAEYAEQMLAALNPPTKEGDHADA